MSSPEAVIICEICIEHVSAEEVTVLVVEIIYGSVGEDAAGVAVALVETLVDVVIGVGGRDAAVGTQFVAPAVGVVRNQFEILEYMESQPVGQRQVVVRPAVVITVGEIRAETAGEQRRSGVSHISRIGVECAVRVVWNGHRAHVLGEIEEYARAVEAFGSVHLPVAAVIVVGVLVAEVCGIIQPPGHLGIHLGPEGHAVIDVFRIIVEQALAVEITAAHIVFHLIVSARHRDIVLGFRTVSLEEEVIPVEVAQIDIGIGSRYVRNYPRTLGVLCQVVAALVHHLYLLRSVGPRSLALQISVELVGQGDIVVCRGDVVGRCRVLGHADASVVADLSLAGLTAPGGDEHDSGGGLCTIDGAGGGILEHGYGFYVVRVDLGEGTLHAIDDYERRWGTAYGCGSAYRHVVVLALNRTAGHGQQQGWVCSLYGSRSIGHWPVVQILAVYYGNCAGNVDPLLGTVAHHHDLVEDRGSGKGDDHRGFLIPCQDYVLVGKADI